MKPPKTQHQLVLWYLYNWEEPFSLKDIINDSMFFKFQTRLSELEKKHGLLSIKKRVKFKNRFGNRSSYLKYSAISDENILRIYNEIQ